MVHMMWRGYRDVVDVDVLPSPAADIYGTPRTEPVWVKTDHCQYVKYNLRGSWCFDATDSVDECRQACNSRGKKCSALNVIPMKMPEISFWAPGDVETDAKEVAYTKHSNTNCGSGDGGYSADLLREFLGTE